jgi:hypothetical protein
MIDEKGNGPSDVAQEAQRLSDAIAKLLVEEKAAANTGMIALCIAMGNAIKQFSNPDDFDADLRKTIEIIRRVATGTPPG